MSKHNHYMREIVIGESKLTVDLYFMLRLFGVTDQAVGHAIKKLMFAGQRGAKGYTQDLNEARDTIDRALELEAELPQLLLDTPLRQPLTSDEYVHGVYTGVALDTLVDSHCVNPSMVAYGTVAARNPSAAHWEALATDNTNSDDDELYQLTEDLITSVDQTIKEADAFREQLPLALPVDG